MTKKNRSVQIVALFALFWIIIWIVWTWVLMLFNGQKSINEQTLSAEQQLELQNLINSQSGWVIETWTGENLGSWTTK